MSSTHVETIARNIGADAASFASLPLPLARRVFLALPPDARGRACCVCRAWRDVLAEPALWSRLDMSVVSRLDQRHFDSVLQGAAGRAHGLCQLDFSQQSVSRKMLLPVLTANAGSLRELHLHVVNAHGDSVSTPTVKAVVAAAPLLRVLTAGYVSCMWEDAPRLLRADPPFALLQLRRSLEVRFEDEFNRVGGIARVGPFAAALADVALQPALSRLFVMFAALQPAVVMGALADAALARRLREITFFDCTPPAAAPLARLLAEGSLSVFDFHSSPHFLDLRTPLFDAAGAALVAHALRMNTTLTKLRLDSQHVCVDMHAAELVLSALEGHLSLRELRLTPGRKAEAAEDRSAFGAALAALIAADAPALHTLNCSCNSLGDAGLEPIVEALALNRHLRELDLRGNDMSEAFARERLLPVVRASTTLRELMCAYCGLWPAAMEAEELVRSRGQHA